MGNKREVWRVKLALAKIRKSARILLTLEEKDPRRLFEGNALLRRLVRIGVLDESKMKLDYVLGLSIEDFLERSLQTRTRQIYSSRPRPHPAKAYQSPQIVGERAKFHRSSRLSEAHRLLSQIPLWRRTSGSRQENELEEGEGRRQRRGGLNHV